MSKQQLSDLDRKQLATINYDLSQLRLQINQIIYNYGQSSQTPNLTAMREFLYSAEVIGGDILAGTKTI